MADDDVLIKIATDVGSTTAAMGTLIQLVAQMNEQFVLAREEAKATGEAIVGAMDVGSRSTQESTQSAVTWGMQWSKVIDQVQAGVLDLVKSFPQLVSQTIDAGDAAYTMSKRLSLSVDTIGKLEYLTKVGGGNLNQLAKTVQELGRTLQDSGSKGAEGIERIGLSTEALKAQGDEAFFTIMETLKERFPDATERSAAAMEIFGRKFANNTQLLNEDMNEVRETVKRLNSGITEETARGADAISDSMTRAGLGADAFRDRLVGHLMPGLEEAAKKLEALPQGLLFFGRAMGETASKMAPLLTNLATFAGKKGLEGAYEQMLKGTPFMTAMKSSFGELLAPLGALIPSLGSIGTLLGALTGPIGLTVIGITALGVLLYKLVGGWDGIVAAMEPVIALFEDMFVVGVKVAEDMFAGLVTWLSETATWFGTLYTAVVKFAVEAFGVLVKWVSDAINWLRQLPVVGAVVDLWIKGVTLYFKFLADIAGKVWGAIKSVLSAMGKSITDFSTGMHAAAEGIRAQQKSAEEAVKANKDLKDTLPPLKTGLERMTEEVRKSNQAYKELTASQKAQIKELLDGKKSPEEIAKVMVSSMKAAGGSVDVATMAIEKFKTSLEDAKKTAKDDPVAKFRESAKDLAAELDRAAKSGQPMAATIDDLGKKAAAMVREASRMPGELDKLKPSIVAAGEAWNAQDLAEKTKDLTAKVTELTTAFGTKASAATATAAAAVRDMQEEIAASFLDGEEAKIAAIDRTERKQIDSLNAQASALDVAEAAEIAKIEAITAKRIEEEEKHSLASGVVSAERIALIHAEEAAALASLAASTDAQKAALNEQADAIQLKAEHDRQVATATTTNVELNLRLQGIATKKQADEHIKTERKKLDTLKALTDPFYKAQIAAQQKVVDQLVLSNDAYEALMKERGITTTAVIQAQLEAQELALKTMVDSTDLVVRAQIDATKERIQDLKNQMAGLSKGSATAFLGPLTDAFSKLALIGGNSFKGITKEIGGVVGSAGLMAEGFSGANKSFENLTKGGKSLGQGLGDAFKTAAGDKGIGGAIKGLMGGLGQVMPMVGGIIAGVTAAIDVGKKLWDVFTTSGGEKAVKEVGKKFGATISEEMGDAISKNAKEMFKGDRFAAELDKMKDLVAKAGGITDKNFTQQLGNLRQVFDLMNRGTYTQAQATKVLDENFGAFAKHVTESGKVASKEFTDIIALQQRMGTTSKEVTDFVTSQTVRLGKALGTLIAPLSKNVGELKKNREEAIKLDEELRKERDKEKPDEKKIADLRKELDALNETFTVTQEKIMGDGTAMARFERLTLAGFNAAVAGGASYLEAVEGIGPALDQLVEANTAMGRTGGEAIQSLLHFREVSTANKELVESSGALNEVMLALSNIGGLNVDTMADLQAQGMDTFNQLTAAGFTETEALQHMKGFLEGVRDAHKELGLPIDENTQALLNQATASGVLRGEQMSTNDIMIQGLGAIIKALKGDLPDAFKTMTKAADESATTVAGTMNTKVGGAIDSNAKKLNATPYASYAAKAVVASDIATGAIGGVDGAIEGVASGLAGTDWAGWAAKAKAAADEAYAAVNKVSQGESPGGIKEIPIELAKAVSAFDAWEKTSVASANAVKDSVDAVKGNSDAIVGMTDATDQRMASMAERQAQNAAAMQQGGEVNISFNISALDGKSVQEVTEKSVIPAIIRTLNRGGEPRRRFMSSLE